MNRRQLEQLLNAIGGAVVTLFVISVITFAATNVRSPESIARASLGFEVTDAQVRTWVREHGLDVPVYERYATWLGHIVRGDLGKSSTTDRPVGDEILPRLAKTLILAGLALLLAVPLSMAIGARVARRPDTREDLSVVTGTAALQAIPEFVIGVALIAVFAVWLKLLPVTSTGLVFGSHADQIKAFVLPACALALPLVPAFVRMTRVTVREVIQTPYVRAATLRGLRDSRVLWAHTMPNAATPLLGYLSLSFVHLISGAIIVENVFAFPGLGQALVSAINSGDTTTVQAVALLMGALFIVFNALCGVGMVYLNPRLKAST